MNAKRYIYGDSANQTPFLYEIKSKVTYSSMSK